MKKCMKIVSLFLMLALLTSPLSVVASAEEMVQSRVLADRLSNGSETDEASVSSFDMAVFSNSEDTAVVENDESISLSNGLKYGVENNANEVFDESPNEYDDFIIVGEDETKRTAKEKHFILDNGSSLAVKYNYPVNYQAADGKWHEIDNSLNEITLKNGTKVFCNNEGLYNAKFSKDNFNEKMVEIESSGYNVAWRIEAISDASVACALKADSQLEVSSDVNIRVKNNAKAHRLTDNEKWTVASDAISEIWYENAFIGDIDIQYVLSSSSIKENIILNQPNDITAYKVQLNSGELTAELINDNRIILSNKNGRMIYVIEAPYMFDSSGNESYDIEVNLTKTDDGYCIVYTPDKDWLLSNERVYPITIDPTISSASTSTGTGNIVDTYVLQNTSSSYKDSEYLRIGFNSAGNRYVSIVQQTSYPNIPKGSQIVWARETVFVNPGTTPANNTVAVYKLTEDWDEDDITYSQLVSGQIEGIYKTSMSLRQNSAGTYYYSFSALNDVIEGYSQYWGTGTLPTLPSYAFTYASSSGTQYTSLCSSEYSSSGYRPIMYIKYFTASAAERTLTSGSKYYLKSALPNNMFLSYSFNSTASICSAYIDDPVDTVLWRITALSDGYCTISVNGMYLAANTTNTGTYNNIGTYLCAGSSSGYSSVITQAKWKVVNNYYENSNGEFVTDGTVRIISAINNSLVFDVANGNTTAETNVVLWRSHFSDNQKWKLVSENDCVGMLSIFSIPAQSGHAVGHSFLSFANMTESNIQLGRFIVKPHTEVTVSRQSNKQHGGVWHNYESVKIYKKNDYSGRVSVSVEINSDEAEAASQVINSSDYYNIATANCVHLALEVWSLTSGKAFDNLTAPNAVCDEIESRDGYETDRRIAEPQSKACYYNNGKLNETDLGD